MIAPDGSGRRQVTLASEVVTAPAWSPDGSLIAYQFDGAGCGTGIGIVSAAGGESEALETGSLCRAGGPAWLATDRLAFWGEGDDGGRDLYEGTRGQSAPPIAIVADAGVQSDPAARPGAEFGSAGPDDAPPSGEVAAQPAASALSRAMPIALLVLLVAAIAGVVARRTVLAPAGAAARRARRRDEDGESSGHASCEHRHAEALADVARARDAAGSSLASALDGVTSGLDAALEGLADATRSFARLAPSEPTPAPSEDEIVDRLLAGLARGVLEGDERA